MVQRSKLKWYASKSLRSNKHGGKVWKAMWVDTRFTTNFSRWRQLRKLWKVNLQKKCYISMVFLYSYLPIRFLIVLMKRHLRLPVLLRKPNPIMLYSVSRTGLFIPQVSFELFFTRYSINQSRNKGNLIAILAAVEKSYGELVRNAIDLPNPIQCAHCKSSEWFLLTSTAFC